MTATEGNTVTLECTLNKPDVPVKWLKDGKPIRSKDNMKIVADGYTHQLVFTELTLTNGAKYKCIAGDVSTQATLTIEGTELSICLSVSMSVCLSLCWSVCLYAGSLCQSVSMSVGWSLCLSVCLYAGFFLCRSLCLSVSMSLNCMSVSKPVCLYGGLSLCLSVYLSAFQSVGLYYGPCLSVSVSLYLSVSMSCIIWVWASECFHLDPHFQLTVMAKKGFYRWWCILHCSKTLMLSILVMYYSITVIITVIISDLCDITLDWIKNREKSTVFTNFLHDIFQSWHQSSPSHLKIRQSWRRMH